MKKVFRTLAAIAAVALAASCASDDGILPAQEVGSHSFEAKLNTDHSGTVIVDCTAAKKTRTTSRAAIFGSSVVDPVRPENLNSATMAELRDLFMTEFPAGKKNLEADHSNLESYSSNFTLVSTGEPITIYPVMVGGDAKNTLSVFWYVGEKMYTKEIWALTEPEVIGSNANGWSCLQDGSGITLNIPKGSVYGFSITNLHSKGTKVQGKPFSTDATQNANNDVHAVTYAKNGRTFIGFEDLELSQSDRDYNDLIIMMTPEQPLSSLIEIETKEEFVCLSDDFNINLGDKDGYVAIPTQAATDPFLFKGVVDIKNYTPTLNSAGELAFKIRLYKDTTDPWANDSWKDTEAGCLTEALPLSYIKGVPSGYEIKTLTKTKGYETSTGDGKVPYLQIDAILQKKQD